MLTCDRPPVEHFDYDDLEKEDGPCGCPLCTRYRKSLGEYIYYDAVCAQHKAGCQCQQCIERHSTHIGYMSALSKRDIYSELSFLVNRRMDETEHTHATGPAFLRWVFDRMTDSGFKSEGWWAVQSPTLRLHEWMEQWQEKNLPASVRAVSGLY